MKKIVLKQDIIERIQNDAILFGKVAFALGVKAVTLPRILDANKSKLTEVSVLRILSEHLKIENQEDLLEVITESEDNNNIENSQFQAVN